MKKCLPAIIFGIILSFQFTPLISQVSLVKDINTIPAQPRQSFDGSDLFCKCNGQLFFTTATTKGRELWRTDGTSDGTILIKDLNKGIADGGTPGVCNGQGQLFFYGNDGIHGGELWISDGTLGGTRMIKDVTPGPSGGYITMLGRLGNSLYFVTDSDLNNQPEVWKSDGSEMNTTFVTDLPFSHMLLIYIKMATDTHVFFNTFNLATGKLELWAIDGTTGNAAKVVENLFINDFAIFGSKVMFSAQDQSTFQYSLWSSDGTTGGTGMVKDLSTRSPQRLHKFNDKLIFGVSYETWISDGTELGTTFLITGSTDGSAVINNKFYGSGFGNAPGSHRIFKTDGTTIEVINTPGGGIAREIPVLNNKLIIQHFDQNVGKELGAVDSDLQSFSLIKDINPGSNSSIPIAGAMINDQVLFLADDGINGIEIWATDGTEAGTHLVKNITTGTADAFNSVLNNKYLTTTDGKIHLLAATDGSFSGGDLSLFSSDGTEPGTYSKFHFGNYPVRFLGKIGDELIYSNAFNFYKTGGSADEVISFKDFTGISTSFSISPYSWSLGDKIIFNANISDGSDTGYEYWLTDGTDQGTKILKDIFPGSQNGGFLGVGVGNNSKFFFNATDPDHGKELWITDGSSSGTTIIKDINPGVSNSNPGEFAAFGDKVIFSATDGQHGTEAWITDGTEQGTMQLLDIVLGSGSSDAKFFTSIGDLVLFTAYDEQEGWALWKTDGTTAGTVLIKDIRPGKEKYYFPKNFASINNKLYFAADDGEHGMELWVSDGTEEGTFLIDIVPGLEGSNPSLFTEVNGVAYFQADAMLWRTNGTINGTSRVSDLEPLEILPLENWVYFIAPHPDYGKELFKVEFKKLEQQITFDPVDSKTVGGAPFQIHAEASSGLPVAITSGDELAIDNQTLTIVKAGTVEVTVQQSGDALYNPAQASQTFCIFPARPTITVTGSEGETVLMSSANVGNQWFEQNENIVGATQKTFAPEEGGVYKLNVTADGCTSEFSKEEVVVITGIEMVEDFILLHPNPAHDHLKIKGTGKKVQVAILDIQGRSMNTFQVDGNEIVEHSLQGFQNGIYVVRIASDRGISYQKFVKE